MDARKSALPHFNGAGANIATGVTWTTEEENRQTAPTQECYVWRHEHHITFSCTGHRSLVLSVVNRQTGLPRGSPFNNKLSRNFRSDTAI